MASKVSIVQLRRAVLENPKNVAHLRSYMRRLQQVCSPREEFQLLQSTLEELRAAYPTRSFDALPPTAACERELRNREEQLLAKHGEEWGQPLAEVGVTHVTYRRGEPYEVFISAESFSMHAATLFERAPKIRELVLTYVPDAPCPPDLTERIIASPLLRRLDKLTLVGAWGDSAARQLAKSPHLVGLRTLDLAETGLGPVSAQALLGSDGFPKLEDLDLSYNLIGPEGAMRIMALVRVPSSLRRLAIRKAGFHDGAAAFLAHADALSQLHELSLDDNPLTDEGVRELFGSEHLKNTIIGVSTDGLLQRTRRTVNEELRERWQRLAGSPPPGS